MTILPPLVGIVQPQGIRKVRQGTVHVRLVELPAPVTDVKFDQAVVGVQFVPPTPFPGVLGVRRSSGEENPLCRVRGVPSPAPVGYPQC